MQVKNEMLKIITKPPKDTIVAYITTASNVEDDKTYLERDRLLLQKIGFQVVDVDIQGKNKNELKQIIKTDTDWQRYYLCTGGKYVLFIKARQGKRF